MKQIILVSIVLFISSLSFINTTWAQEETGYPFTYNYNYNNSDNWDILQDKRGIMYCGNINGVLEFDGLNWRLIELSNKSLAHSIEMDSTGKIYVGGTNEIGFLKPDKFGKLKYVSLLGEFDEKNFAIIWSIAINGNEVFFQSMKTLFRFRNDSLINTWHSSRFYHRCFVVNGKFYTKKEELGLTVLKNDSLQLVQGGGFFKDKTISAMFPLDDEQVLIGTRLNGLYFYMPEQYDSTSTKINKNGALSDGQQLFYKKPEFSEADRFLIQNRMYHGIELPDNKIAFVTLEGGAIVLDKTGKEVLKMNKQTGLLNDYNTFLTMGNQNNLWLAMNSGISRLELYSPLEIYDENAGLRGGIKSIFRYKGILYVGTDSGIYYLENNSFKPLDGIATQSWSLLNWLPHSKNKLLFGANDGIYEVVGKKAVRIVKESYITELHSYIKDSSLLFATSLLDGLAVLKYKDNEWQNIGRIPDIKEQLVFIEEDSEGDLWLGSLYDGVVHLELPKHLSDIQKPEDLNYRIKRYNRNDGLPVMHRIGICKFNGRLLFTTEKGLYRFDRTQKRFFPDSSLGTRFSDGSTGVLSFVEDSVGDLFLCMFDKDKHWLEIGRTQANGKYEWRIEHIEGLQRKELEKGKAFPDINGIYWLGINAGLIKFDSKITSVSKGNFQTFIRYVKTGQDSVVYWGGYSNEDYPQYVDVISLNDNNITFKYIAPFFRFEKKIKYSYILEGQDENWSLWTKNTTKEYTNLSSGNYTFKVKGKNIYGLESDIAIYRFNVQPTWYSTWWMIGIYVGLVIIVIFLIVKYYTRHLIKEKDLLKERVKERTEKLEETYSQLIVSEKMASLGKLSASIAHEINSPLGAIGASIKNISDSLDYTINKLPEQIKNIPSPELEIFFNLVRTKSDNLYVTTRDEREIKRKLIRELEETGIENADILADKLVDMKIYSGSDFLPLLKMKNAPDILNMAYHIATLQEDSMNISDAVSKASKIVVALRKYMYKKSDGKKNQADIANNIETILTLYRSQIKLGVKVLKKFEKIPLVNCYVDELNQVWINIIQNALHAMNNNGNLEIKISPSFLNIPDGEKKVAVSIAFTDDGCGISDDIRPKIFDTFFTTKKQEEGSGLGLDIVKKIIDKHDGKIEVQSEEGKGATFTVTIPV